MHCYLTEHDSPGAMVSIKERHLELLAWAKLDRCLCFQW